MKKILITLIALTLAVLTLASCFKFPQESGNKDTPAETPAETPQNGSQAVPAPDFDFFAEDLTKYVKLGTYKGMTFDIHPMEYMSEEDFQKQVIYELLAYGCYTEIKDRKVEKDDIIKFDYEGYMNGEKFDGGSGTESLFTIYNGGGFIEGFADSIIGATPGEQISFDIAFPEDYFAEELAGKTATFKVTVTFIYKVEEITDEKIKEMSGGDMNTYKEFEDAMRDVMKEDVEGAYLYEKLEMIWEKIMETSELINMPDELLDSYYNYILSYYESIATSNLVTLDFYLEYLGLTKEQVKEDTKKDLYKDMIVYSIIKAEGIELTDEIFKEELQKLADYNGITTDEVYDYYTEKDLREMFYYSLGYEAVVEYNTFNVKETNTEETPAA